WAVLADFGPDNQSASSARVAHPTLDSTLASLSAHDPISAASQGERGLPSELRRTLLAALDITPSVLARLTATSAGGSQGDQGESTALRDEIPLLLAQVAGSSSESERVAALDDIQ